MSRLRLRTFVLLLIAIAAPFRASPQTSVRVMTWNMDAGTDLNYLSNATSAGQLIVGLVKTWNEISASGFTERAAAMADVIAAQQPDIIGLQEATLWLTGPVFQPANTKFADQLQLLHDALEVRGQHFDFVYRSKLTDATLPVLAPGNLFDLRWIDTDAILARSDRVSCAPSGKGYYNTNWSFAGITILRGWTAADCAIAGVTFKFVTTHLEDASGEIQVAQGDELIQLLKDVTIPVFVGGDLNCNAEPGAEHYATLDHFLGAGYTDTFRAANPGTVGMTWPLHGEDPYTPIAAPSERIDYVLSRGLAPASSVRAGNRLSDRSAGGLWPSDHAAVMTTFIW